MSVTAVVSNPSAYVPLRLTNKPIPVQLLVVAAATAFLAACSWISVPMLPVPVTMQTFAVTVIGALFGWRLGAISVLAWMAEGMLGLPVLSGGAAGLAHFAGPTGGYIFAFPVVAALVGWCAERGLTSRSVYISFALMLVANALILAIGAAWLAEFVGTSKAIPLGVTPFLIGGVLKAALASTSIEAARRHLRF